MSLLTWMIQLRLLTRLKLLSREIGLIVREVIVNIEKMLVHREIEKKAIFLSIYSRYVEYNSTTSGCQNTKLEKLRNHNDE